MRIKSKFPMCFKAIALVSTIVLTSMIVSFDPSMAEIYSGIEVESVRPAHRKFVQRYEHEIIRILENSWMHGLNPVHYNLDKLEDLGGFMSFTRQDEIEDVLINGFTRYISDMSGMRVSPEGLRIDRTSWRQPLSQEAALTLLGGGKTLGQIMAMIKPQSTTYQRLQEELVRLSREPAEPYVSVLPLRFERLVYPGERHERIPDLRMRLGVQPQTSDLYLYDDRLTAALIRFQRENGLGDDGIIGSRTLDALNRSRADLMRQLIANMERLRWVDEVRPSKFVVVNIPSATLWAVDDNQVEFEMSVIVGRSERPTQSFITEIKGVRFNPDWTIPPGIKKKDMLPKLREDPSYFIDKGIEIFDGYGAQSQTLDPQSIDWHNIGAAEFNALRMVQTPGRHNALGRVRVLMPNDFDIYLHDTNHPELFNKQARALSSGCIRLKEPLKMASFIMRDRPGWTGQYMNGLLDAGKTRDISIPGPIPVYILYYTTWIDSDGRIVYGTDIYDQDKKLIEKLAKVDGFSIPGHNIKIQVSSDRAEVVSVK